MDPTFEDLSSLPQTFHSTVHEGKIASTLGTKRRNKNTKNNTLTKEAQNIFGRRDARAHKE